MYTYVEGWFKSGVFLLVQLIVLVLSDFAVFSPCVSGKRSAGSGHGWLPLLVSSDLHVELLQISRSRIIITKWRFHAAAGISN